MCWIEWVMEIKEEGKPLQTHPLRMNFPMKTRTFVLTKVNFASEILGAFF
jgi:hypothetical protein